MEHVQFILQHIGRVTINHEYTVDLQAGQALQIDWFADNDIIITTNKQEMYYNAQNTTQIDEHTYLIQILTTSDLHNLPVKFERYPYIIADNIVINQEQQTYFTADAIDIMPDEIVATHGNHATRLLFSGDKIATEEYIKKQLNDKS